MMLKVRNERIGSGGYTRGIVSQKWVHRKGVGELLDQCSQCNYITGLNKGYPNASYNVVNPNLHECSLTCGLGMVTDASSRI